MSHPSGPREVCPSTTGVLEGVRRVGISAVSIGWVSRSMKDVGQVGVIQCSTRSGGSSDRRVLCHTEEMSTSLTPGLIRFVKGPVPRFITLQKTEDLSRVRLSVQRPVRVHPEWVSLMSRTFDPLPRSHSGSGRDGVGWGRSL